MLVALVMVVVSSQIAQAETLTLSCFPKKMTYVIDFSANTVVLKDSGVTFNCTDVAISDSTISFVIDSPGIFHAKTVIDRTTGTISADYYYPQGGGTGPSREVGQCTKIPDKAF